MGRPGGGRSRSRRGHRHTRASRKTSRSLTLRSTEAPRSAKSALGGLGAWEEVRGRPASAVAHGLSAVPTGESAGQNRALCARLPGRSQGGVKLTVWSFRRSGRHSWSEPDSNRRPPACKADDTQRCANHRIERETAERKSKVMGSPPVLDAIQNISACEGTPMSDADHSRLLTAKCGTTAISGVCAPAADGLRLLTVG
jgi:hypothetical protein